MKLRIDRDWASRARACADAVDLSLVEWSRRVWRKWQVGGFDGVAVPAIEGTATRAGSVVVTVSGAQEQAAVMRVALMVGVVYCEARLPKPFVPHLREGVDYIVEVEA